LLFESSKRERTGDLIGAGSSKGDDLFFFLASSDFLLISRDLEAGEAEALAEEGSDGG